MQRSPRQPTSLLRENIQIRQVALQKEVARLYVELRSRGRVPHSSTIKLDKCRVIFKEQPLFAHSASLDITRGGRNKKRSPVFENARPIVGWRLRKFSYVVVFGYRVRQLRGSIAKGNDRWLFSNQFAVIFR